jgi:DNA-binding transcriptional LysR family regulator
MTCNNVEALIFAAVRGLGIAYLPGFVVRESLITGALVFVLDDYMTDGGKFSVLWPSSRHLLPKLRVFVDFLAKKLVLG